jgi:leader peptidase (prepilin peptidase) / N-methyltransferase
VTDIVLLACLILLFSFWGSFLNVLGFRLIRGQTPLRPLRSYCPACHRSIHAYDLIPIFSWLWLRGRCRRCHAKISLLYPLIELLTIVLLCALYFCIPNAYFWSYFIFVSALIVIVRSDLEKMLISQYTTIFLIPIALGAAFLQLLPISFSVACFGAVTGYFFLYSIAWLHRKTTGVVGLGQGDVEMLGMIGAFLGPVGWWISVMIASITGSLFGFVCILVNRSYKNIKLPFGPFLACGALIYLFMYPTILHILQSFY